MGSVCIVKASKQEFRSLFLLLNLDDVMIECVNMLNQSAALSTEVL